MGKIQIEEGLGRKSRYYGFKMSIMDGHTGKAVLEYRSERDEEASQVADDSRQRDQSPPSP